MITVPILLIHYLQPPSNTDNIRKQININYLCKLQGYFCFYRKLMSDVKFN